MIFKRESALASGVHAVAGCEAKTKSDMKAMCACSQADTWFAQGVWCHRHGVDCAHS